MKTDYQNNEKKERLIGHERRKEGERGTVPGGRKLNIPGMEKGSMYLEGATRKVPVGRRLNIPGKEKGSL